MKEIATGTMVQITGIPPLIDALGEILGKRPLNGLTTTVIGRGIFCAACQGLAYKVADMDDHPKLELCRMNLIPLTPPPGTPIDTPIDVERPEGVTA